MQSGRHCGARVAIHRRRQVLLFAATTPLPARARPGMPVGFSNALPLTSIQHLLL
jgi:hypothetical protein